MDLLPHVSETILKHDLLNPGDRLILAVSGGPDSTALVDILVRFSQEYFPIEMALACLDHGLWPESREHKEKIQPLADRYSLPLFWEQVLLLEQKQTSIEERGREERYRFLEQTAIKFGAKKVAVAHHANDEAETVLFHLLRGSGIFGLAAMTYQRPIVANSSVLLIRPLLEIYKEELLKYLKMREIPWWDDPSNSYMEMARNRLRHRIIPFLQKEGYSNITSQLCRTAKRCQEIEEYLSQEAQNFLRRTEENWCSRKPDVEKLFWLLRGKKPILALSNEKLDTLSHALLPFVLRKIFESLGAERIAMGERHYEMFQNLAQHSHGLIQFPYHIQALRVPSMTYFYLDIPWIIQFPEPFSLPGMFPLSPTCMFRFDLLCAEHAKQKPPSLLQANLNHEMISFPVHLAFWKEGDTIHPLGSPGKKKISHILSDNKIPLPLRKKILTLRDIRGNILWIPGICISHPHRITPQTQKIAQFDIS